MDSGNESTKPIGNDAQRSQIHPADLKAHAAETNLCHADHWCSRASADAHRSEHIIIFGGYAGVVKDEDNKDTDGFNSDAKTITEKHIIVE